MIKRTVVLMFVQFLWIFSQPPRADGAAPRFVVTARFDDVVEAYSIQGTLTIDLRELRVETTGPYGKPVPYRILVIFAPQSKSFSWMVFPEDSPAETLSRQILAFKRERAVFVKDGRVISFLAGMAPLTLYIEDQTAHATDLADAEKKALEGAAEFKTRSGNLDLTSTAHTVSLSGLSIDFVHSPDNAMLGPQPKVSNVEWDGTRWIVKLQARWTESIALDAEYNLLSMQKME